MQGKKQGQKNSEQTSKTLKKHGGNCDFERLLVLICVVVDG